VLDPRFQAQLERVRSDDWLRERARAALELTAEERLSTEYRLCRAAGELLDRQPREVIDAVEAARGSLDNGAVMALRRLLRGLST
jgi:hypothetical protein